MGFPMKRQKPLELPALTEGEIIAIKCLADGVANEGQQKAALEIILRKFCTLGISDFDADARVHAFNSGKQYVGQQLVYIVEEALDRIPKLQ